MDRAYSILEVKAVQDGDDRVIEGVASTPTLDHHGDIMDPMGAQFSLPMPLLWQHRVDEPVGVVEFAQPTQTGIPFRARISRLDERGAVKDRLDMAWHSVKAGVVRGVSIGCTFIDDVIRADGARHVRKWQWHELSLVVLPANVEATIHNIKSFDQQGCAASGNVVPADLLSDKPARVVKLSDPARARATPFVIRKVYH